MVESKYKVGERVVCDKMLDEFPVPRGTKGTIEVIDSTGTLFVKFDNGRQIGLIPGVDRFHKIS